MVGRNGKHYKNSNVQIMILYSREQEFKLLSNLIEEMHSSKSGDSMSFLETVAEIKRKRKIEKSNLREISADLVNKKHHADSNRETQTTQERIIIRTGEKINNRRDVKLQNKKKERSSIN